MYATVLCAFIALSVALFIAGNLWDYDYSCSSYEFFNERELEDCRSKAASKADMDTLHKFKENEVRKKLARMSLSMNRYLAPTDDNDQLRLVLIGKTGQGKSATGNTLLGKDVFMVDSGHQPATKTSKIGNATVDGRNITVLDMPGLQDADMTDDQNSQENTRRIFEEGVHAFMYVINLADPRFTKEDARALVLLQEAFGREFLRYCILVFTHGNDLDEDLDTYIRHQREVATHHFSRHGTDDRDSLVIEEFADFLDILSWRIVAIDNHLCSPFEKKRHRDTIFAMVDKMTPWNYPEAYSLAYIKQIRKRNEERRRARLMDGWDPDELGMVEEIIAGYPSITREQLERAVNRRIRKKMEEAIRKAEESERRTEEEEKQRAGGRSSTAVAIPQDENPLVWVAQWVWKFGKAIGIW